MCSIWVFDSVSIYTDCPCYSHVLFHKHNTYTSLYCGVLDSVSIRTVRAIHTCFFINIILKCHCIVEYLTRFLSTRTVRAIHTCFFINIILTCHYIVQFLTRFLSSRTFCAIHTCYNHNTYMSLHCAVLDSVSTQRQSYLHVSCQCSPKLYVWLAKKHVP